MRYRGISTMRREPGGRFSLAHSYKRCESTAVLSGGYHLVSGVSGHRVDTDLEVYPGMGNGLQRYRRGTCMNVDEEAVRLLAQLIWETEGQPEGQDARHWEMATKLAESAAMAPVRTSHRATVNTLFPAPDEEPKG